MAVTHSLARLLMTIIPRFRQINDQQICQLITGHKKVALYEHSLPKPPATLPLQKVVLYSTHFKVQSLNLIRLCSHLLFWGKDKSGQKKGKDKVLSLNVTTVTIFI